MQTWDLIKDGYLSTIRLYATRFISSDRMNRTDAVMHKAGAMFNSRRMPNVSLAPGKDPYSVDQMIKDVEKGIYIAGRGSYSIDQQRYNFSSEDGVL